MLLDEVSVNQKDYKVRLWQVREEVSEDDDEEGKKYPTHLSLP